MALGLSSKFNILQRSPHDLKPQDPAPPMDAEDGQERWVPSRYNIRASTDDGRLVLWNSYKGTMSVFEAEQKPTIELLLSQKGVEARPEGVVKYLRDRGFLVKAGTDEYRRIQLGFGHQHYRTDVLQLILLASEDCNFRCQYCYEQFARGTMEPQVRLGVKRLIENRLRGLQHLSISWFGGEPLYGFDAIEDLAPFFVETTEKHGIRYSSNMTTNGYLLTPDVAEKLLAWKINSYQITLDGPPECHDCSRPTRDGDGTFSTIFDNLKALKRRPESYAVDIRVNFDKNNHHGLKAFLEVVEREFTNDSRFKLRFRPVGRWGGSNDGNLEVCGLDEAAQVQMEMKMEARKRGLSLSDDIRHVKKLGAQVCYAARPYNFIVGADGKLMKCTIDLDMQDRNIVGRLTEGGDLDLDLDKLALWTEPAFEKDKKCQKCVILPTCQGMFCPQLRMDTGKSPCSPLRKDAKKELMEVLQRRDGDTRKVTVQRGELQHDRPAASAVA